MIPTRASVFWNGRSRHTFDYGEITTELNRRLTQTRDDLLGDPHPDAGTLRGYITDIQQMLHRQGYLEQSPYVRTDHVDPHEYIADLCHQLVVQLYPDREDAQERASFLLWQLHAERSSPWTITRLATWYHFVRQLDTQSAAIDTGNCWWILLRIAAEHSISSWLDSDGGDQLWHDYQLARNTALHIVPHSHTVLMKLKRLPTLAITHSDRIYTDTGSLPLAGVSFVAHLSLHYLILTAAYADQRSHHPHYGAHYAAINTALCQFIDRIVAWREYHAKTHRP